MGYTSFDEILRSAKKLPSRSVMAVAAAADPHSLEAALSARKAGIADPLLVGGRDGILKCLEALGESVPDENIIDAADPTEAAAKAVALVREALLYCW